MSEIALTSIVVAFSTRIRINLNVHNDDDKTDDGLSDDTLAEAYKLLHLNILLAILISTLIIIPEDHMYVYIVVGKVIYDRIVTNYKVEDPSNIINLALIGILQKSAPFWKAKKETLIHIAYNIVRVSSKKDWYFHSDCSKHIPLRYLWTIF